MLGVSLFCYSPGATYLPFRIAFSDIAIALLIFYALSRVQRVDHNSISHAAILLAGLFFLSGGVNFFTRSTFDGTNFLFNYLRMIGLVAMVFFLPPMLRRIGEDRLARSLILVLRFQCIVLLLDAFGVIPVEWLPSIGPRTSRPAGLFIEPGWFGTWLGLSVFYVIQVQHNRQIPLISNFDIGLWLIAVVTSTGMRGVVLVGFALAWLISSMKAKRLKLIIALLVICILFTLLVKKFSPQDTIYRGTGEWDVGEIAPHLAGSYVLGRLTAMSPFALTDSSTLNRLESTRLGVLFTIRESPLLGLGLGGKSQQAVLPVLEWNRIIESSGASLMPLSVFLAGGLLALPVFLFIMIKIVLDPATRLFGYGFTLTSIVWGGAFESWIWWYIALASALMGTQAVKEHASITEPRKDSGSLRWVAENQY